MTSDFKTLKEKVDILDYIQRQTGSTAKKLGKSHAIDPCPLCDHKDCFRINQQDQYFKCQSCEAGGDVFEFVQRFKSCTKKEALEKVASDQNYELQVLTKEKKLRSPEEEKARNDKLAIFEEAANYYHKGLLNNKKAIGYQRKVRRHSDASLKAFRVGHADGRLYEHLKGIGYTDKQLIDTGLVRLKDDGRLKDFFGYNNFIYPQLDKKNRVAGFTLKAQKKGINYRLNKEHWRENCFFYNMQAFQGKEIFLVEGENDLLSVYGRGEMENVAAINGQLSKEQLDYLVDWAPGKKVILCFDNDTAGRGYTEKVCRAFKKLCLPATFAGLSKDQTTELLIVRFDSAKDIDEYLKEQGDPASTLKNLANGAQRYLRPLMEVKALYSTLVGDPENKLKFSYDTLGKICFEWFQARGAFYVEGDNCHLYYDKRPYQIGNNTPFKALLYEVAGINAAASGAKLVIQSIESQAYNKGGRTSARGWIETDIEKNTIYFNLCDDSCNLLKISPGKIEQVPNGTNLDQILLKNSPNMKPLCFDRKVNVRKGMERLKTHLFDNLTCNTTDRYFIICLLFNSVFIHYTRARGINRFSGSNSCGKSSGAGLLSVAIMGENRVSIGTAASNFSEAAVSPLVIVDNLESDAVKGGQKDFLLTTATGATRQKRDQEKTTGNAYERPLAQVVVTAIEPFAEPELIQRTNEIIFADKYFKSDFIEATAVEANIIRDRDLIWSSIFKIIAYDILPEIGRKKADVLERIKKEHPVHSKKRLNELYAMLYLILEEVTKYISQPGFENDPSEAQWIFKEWIVAQNQRAFATESGSNKILSNLEALVKEYELYPEPEHFKKVYGLKVQSFGDGTREPQEITFTASTGDLHRAFDILARERGTKNPFRNSGQLGARITGSLETMENCGWKFKRNAKTIRGARLHQLVRIFEL